MKVAPTTGPGEGLPRVLRFRAGGLELGVLVPEVARIVDPADLVRVPYAHQALAGLWIDDEGAQTPIFSLRGLSDPRAPFSDNREVRAYLVFDTEVGPVGLRVAAVRGTLDRYHQQDELGEVPEPLVPVLAGRGEAEDEEGRPAAFYFFSPGAFLAALDVLAPLKPGGIRGK